MIYRYIVIHIYLHILSTVSITENKVFCGFEKKIKSGELYQILTAKKSIFSNSRIILLPVLCLFFSGFLNS